jgi:hypothetical protein
VVTDLVARDLQWEERLSDRADMIEGAKQGLLRRVFATGKAPN